MNRKALEAAMSRVFGDVVERFHGDLAWDFKFLDRIEDGTHTVKAGESVRWSVGDCGSHIGIASDGHNPVWWRSYGHYIHYRLDLEAGAVVLLSGPVSSLTCEL